MSGNNFAWSHNFYCKIKSKCRTSEAAVPKTTFKKNAILGVYYVFIVCTCQLVSSDSLDIGHSKDAK